MGCGLREPQLFSARLKIPLKTEKFAKNICMNSITGKNMFIPRFHNIGTGLALICALGSPTPTLAAISSFQLDWSGAVFGNQAEAHALLSVDDILFPDTSGLVWLTPGIEVTGFNITVSGAATGNGNFDLTDYAAFIWDTTGATLDFTQELVGQTISSGYNWGEGYDTGGDFSLIAAELSNAPTGDGWYFKLATANGTGDNLKLTSFRPYQTSPVQPVPLPSAFWLFATVFGLLHRNAWGERR
jgi:hypothetical protein